MRRAVRLLPFLVLGCTNASPPEPATDGSAGSAATDVTGDSATESTSDGGDGDTASGTTGAAAEVSDDFDETPGENIYGGGLDADNWVDATVLPPNAGTQAFASANGNASTSFPDLALHKELGGAVENTEYEVSFWIVIHVEGSQGVEAGDFGELRVGGPDGTVLWQQTPVPVFGQWQQWVGRYVPAPADVGEAFSFDAVFTLDGEHSIGIDGPVSAVPVDSL
jgi:hypothetical protein